MELVRCIVLTLGYVDFKASSKVSKNIQCQHFMYFIIQSIQSKSSSVSLTSNMINWAMALIMEFTVGLTPLL